MKDIFDFLNWQDVLAREKELKSLRGLLNKVKNSILYDIPDSKKRTETMNDNSKNKLIVYLDSFEEFTDYEQKMLNRVVATANGNGRFWDSIEHFLMS